MTRIFPPGRHVIVTLPEVGPLPGRVEEATEDELSIALFVRPEKPIAWLRGDVSVEAATPRGVYEVSGRLSQKGKGLEALVGVELSGESRVVQRRNYVRVDAVVSALVARDDGGEPEEGEEHECAVLNVSGGGFLLVGLDWLTIGDRVRFRLAVGEDAIAVEGIAKVVRLAEKGARGCEIVEIDDAGRETLIRFTFDRQRAELRRRG